MSGLNQELNWEYNASLATLMDAWDKTSQSQIVIPLWARQLFVRSGESNLVFAITKLVDKVLTESDALKPNQVPIVRLLKVAHLLNANVLLSNDGLYTGYEPEITRQRRKSWDKGLLTRNTLGEWEIHAGNPYSANVRYSVAHELSHALIYSDRYTIDTDAWRASQRTDMEEALCNYAARLILMPAAILSNKLNSTCNPASQVIRTIVDCCRVPIKAAAIRWLDLSDGMDSKTFAFILWRQYHPWNDSFVKVCLRGFPKLDTVYRSWAQQLRASIPNIDFKGAIYVWKMATNMRGEDTFLFKSLALSSEALQLIECIKKFTSNIINQAQKTAVMSLAKPATHLSFRPEFVAWKGLGCFVPLKKGGARRDSLVGKVALGKDQIEESILENIDIGRLKGRFVTDVFAHGDSSKGVRFILQAISMC